MHHHGCAADAPRAQMHTESTFGEGKGPKSVWRLDMWIELNAYQDGWKN
jgi:hypothetical protein